MLEKLKKSKEISGKKYRGISGHINSPLCDVGKKTRAKLQATLTVSLQDFNQTDLLLNMCLRRL
jgi:hypothetical protein